jgi:hypothetical protein
VSFVFIFFLAVQHMLFHMGERERERERERDREREREEVAVVVYILSIC